MLLTLMTFVPLVGAVAVLCLPKENLKAIRWAALLFSGIALVLSIVVMWPGVYNYSAEGIQMVTKVQWLRDLNVHYHIGIDGLSMPLLVLTTLLTLLCVIYSWRIEQRVKEYFFMFLLLETGMLGVFISLDFVLFYVFWEISLVPMYFIIGIWGGPRREYAAIKFFLYTLVGSVAMLLAILALYVRAGTFDMLEMAAQRPYIEPHILPWIFWGLFLGFAIKVPMFPFHTWLPDAHVEAPTAGSVILAGVLLKMGTYGFLRIILPILPQASRDYAPYIAVLATIAIVYGALVAMAQWDLKKLIAYSSVNHMGYVMLGIAAALYLGKGGQQSSQITALNGATLEMVNHGIITGALFFLVGVIYDRTHTRDLKQFGGLGSLVPIYAFFLSMAMFASLGLPGLSGFIAEFYVFLGAFPNIPVFTVISGLGIIVTAAFFLWTIQRVLLGPVNEKWRGLVDMDRRELLALTPLALLMLLFGVFPGPLVSVIQSASRYIIQHM